MRNEPKSGYLSEVFVSFQGEGGWVGRRQLFIRLAGCRRQCAYCDTARSRVRKPPYWLLKRGSKTELKLTNPVTVASLLPKLKQLLVEMGPVHSVALTGGEPTEQPEFLNELIIGLKKNLKEIKILLETNGLEDVLKIHKIAFIDFASVDIKLPSASRLPIQLSRYRHVLPLFPQKHGCIKLVFGVKSTKTEIRKAAALAKSCQPSWELFLQPITGISWGQPRLTVKLETLTHAALAVNGQARLLPQIHPILGIK